VAVTTRGDEPRRIALHRMNTESRARGTGCELFERYIENIRRRLLALSGLAIQRIRNARRLSRCPEYLSRAMRESVGGESSLASNASNNKRWYQSSDRERPRKSDRDTRRSNSLALGLFQEKLEALGMTRLDDYQSVRP
jgi:hypothetical protein